MGSFRFAGLLALPLASAIAACAPAPSTVQPTPAPGQTTAPTAASGAPEATPSALPSTSPSGVVPTASAPASALDTVIVKGFVYDAKNAAVPDGTIVTVKSLDSETPYSGSTQTNSGSYVLNGVPVNVQVEITATREGWTTRKRVGVARPIDPRGAERNTFNFGGASSAADLLGSSYFLDDHPEIERVEPVDDDASLPNDGMKFKMVLSEPLDTENLRRLASAFLIIPNNAEAISDNTSLPEETATKSGDDVDPDAPEFIDTTAELTGLHGGADPFEDAAYKYRQNSGFLNGFTVSEFKWDADNRTATFELQAPVKTDKDDEAEYAFLLINRDDHVIEDGSGQPLGMDQDNKWGQYAKEDIIFNAIKEPNLSVSSGQGEDAEIRWAETHLSYTHFSVLSDTVAPKVVSVLARRNYVEGDTEAADRVEITFSEPMVAFPAIMSPQLLSLNNYIVTAGPNEDEVSKRKLTSDGSASDVPDNAAFETVRDAIEGVSGMLVDDNGAGRLTGSFYMTLSVKDPRVVIFRMPAGSLPLDADFVKVFVGSDANTNSGEGKSASDPAGNSIDASNATAVGPIY